MPHRSQYTKSARNVRVTVDLLADWRPFADALPEPRSDHDWRYCGTITLNGVMGAMAWRAGHYGIGTGRNVRELNTWGNIAVTHVLLFESPPGLDRIPRFAPVEMANSSTFMRE